MVLALCLQALVSLVLSIAAKFLEKPRKWEDFLGVSAEGASIWTMIGHITDQIEPNDSPSTITNKAIVQAKRDMKNIVFSARKKNEAQITVLRTLIKLVRNRLTTSSTVQSAENRKSQMATVEAGDACMERDKVEGMVDPNSATASSNEIIKYKKKRELICNVLLVVSDAQTMTGTILP